MKRMQIFAALLAGMIFSTDAHAKTIGCGRVGACILRSELLVCTRAGADAIYGPMDSGERDGAIRALTRAENQECAWIRPGVKIHVEKIEAAGRRSVFTVRVGETNFPMWTSEASALESSRPVK